MESAAREPPAHGAAADFEVGLAVQVAGQQLASGGWGSRLQEQARHRAGLHQAWGSLFSCAEY